MASNEIAYAYDGIVEHLEDAADGAQTFEVEVGLKQNKQSNLRANLEALRGRPAGPGGVPAEVPGAKTNWNIAKAAKTAATAALRTAVSNARKLVTACINSLKPVLGNQWNSAWNAAGFTDGSLAVPDNPLTLLQQFRGYYVANPAREVANMNGQTCTAAACLAAWEAISDAQSASNLKDTEADAAKVALDAEIGASRKRLTGLREELDQLINDSDERWYAFGFEKPSDPSTPEMPVNLVVTIGAEGSRTLIINWDDARRADSYRVRMTRVSDSVEVVNQIVQDSEFTATNLPAGAEVSITVTARNAAGETQPAGPVNADVP